LITQNKYILDIFLIFFCHKPTNFRVW